MRQGQRVGEVDPCEEDILPIKRMSFQHSASLYFFNIKVWQMSIRKWAVARSSLGRGVKLIMITNLIKN